MYFGFGILYDVQEMYDLNSSPLIKKISVDVINNEALMEVQSETAILYSSAAGVRQHSPKFVALKRIDHTGLQEVLGFRV